MEMYIPPLTLSDNLERRNSGLTELFNPGVDAVSRNQNQDVKGDGVDGAVHALSKHTGAPSNHKTHQNAIPLLGDKHVPVTGRITPGTVVVDERNPSWLGRRGTAKIYL